MKVKTTFKILMACAIIIPSLVVGLIGSIQYRSFYMADATNKATYSAINASVAVREFFSNQVAELSALSRSDVVQSAAAGDYTSVKSSVKSLISNQMKNPYVLDFLIMDGSGLVIAADSESSLQKTFFDYGDPLLEVGTDGFYVSPIYIDNEKYFKSVIVITKPLVTATGETGYISRVLSVDALAIFIKSCDFLEGNGRIVLIDPNGNAINYTLGQVTRSAELHGRDISYVKTEMDNTSKATGVYRLNEGGSLGAYGPINSTQWKWMAVYPTSIVSGSISEAVITGVIIFAIFAVICAIVCFFVYRAAVNPIKRLLKSLQEIKSGDRDGRLPADSSYEFNNISQLFNGMMDDAYISEEIHRTISNLSDNMLFEWNLDENKMYASDNFAATFPIDLERANLLDGTFLDSLMSDKDGLKFRRDLSALLSETKEHIDSEYRIKTNNDDGWFIIRAKAITSRMGDITRIIGVATDITSEKKQTLSLAQRASYDFLSQLYNRSTFLRELQTRLESRRANEQYAILFVDVDDFKFINDRYSHSVGDEVIKFVSDTLKNNLGNNGFAGRFGGDEFVMCITNTAMIPDIDNFAMEIIDLLYQGYHCQNENFDTILNVKASIGISIAPDHSNTADKLVGMADEAMYFVKKNGKSNYHIYDASDAADPNLDNTLA